MNRTEWGKTQPRCWLCGKEAWQVFPCCLTTHEIVRGASRQHGIKMASAWIRCCFTDHGVIDGWPIPKQLCLKFICDPDNFDRVAVNRARGRADNAITEDEIMVYYEELLNARCNGR